MVPSGSIVMSPIASGTGPWGGCATSAQTLPGVDPTGGAVGGVGVVFAGAPAGGEHVMSSPFEEQTTGPVTALTIVAIAPSGADATEAVATEPLMTTRRSLQAARRNRRAKGARAECDTGMSAWGASSSCQGIRDCAA